VARVRCRRAIVLMRMTLVLPGSAQLVAGNRRVGRIALRVWFACWASLLLVVAACLVWYPFAFWLGSTPWVLTVVRLGLVLLAVGGALVRLVAGRIGAAPARPTRPPWVPRA